MDNPVTESTALDTNSAAAAFASILNPGTDSLSEQPEEVKKREAPTEVEAEGEQPEAEASEESAEDDQLVTIKVDGQEIQVPLSELKNGYQRQADYTRKTMEVSEQRKAAEAESQKALPALNAFASARDNLLRILRRPTMSANCR